MMGSIQIMAGLFFIGFMFFAFMLAVGAFLADPLGAAIGWTIFIGICWLILRKISNLVRKPWR